MNGFYGVIKCLRDGERAQSLVETAVAIPIVMVLFAGCVQLFQIGLGGIIVHIAAFEAAREVCLADGNMASGRRTAERICGVVSRGETRLIAEGHMFTVTHHLKALFPIIRGIEITQSCPDYLFKE